MEEKKASEVDGRGGEVRKVHIIYFLSRMGRIEHPHLIRVHHLSRNGIHLRDVKRWLSELRGKDMPDAFSWSYKRRYKTGYVWQDLLDDDLITPISDNEFVLKGSEIAAFSFDACVCGKKNRNEMKPQQALMNAATEEQTPSLYISSSTKTSQTEEDSGPLDSETSASTEESFKTSSVFTPDTTNFFKGNTTPGATDIEEMTGESVEKRFVHEKIKQQPKSNAPKSKNHPSGGSSNVFRNLLNCGAVETNDAAMRMVNKNSSSAVNYSPLNHSSQSFGGSERISSRALWNQQQAQPARNSFSGVKSSKKSNELPNQRKVSAAYKPVREPHCSQCGKTFKPEKLHTHMKACKGVRSLGKNHGAGAATPDKMASPDVSSEPLLKKQPLPKFSF